MEAQQAKPYVSAIARIEREEGHKEGRKEGRKVEAIRLLLRLLTHRFGEVPATVQSRMQGLALGQIEPLVDVALAQETLDGFIAQLPAPTTATVESKERAEP